MLVLPARPARARRVAADRGRHHLPVFPAWEIGLGHLQRRQDDELLDARLAGRAALVGNAFSLADLAVASTLAFGTMCGLTLDPWPHVVAWLERCTSRPARQQAR